MSKASREGARAGRKPAPAASGVRGWGAPLLLALAVLAAWSNTFHAPFLFDDNNAVLTNPHIRSLWPLWEAMSAPDQSTVAGRPVVALTLAINHAISGLKPWSYHLFNLLIHLLTTWTLYGILRRTLLLPRFTGRGSPGAGWALAAALVWALHPLVTESVTYVSTRTESLMALFYLFALYSLIRGHSSATPGRWTAAAILSCALAMGSKEVAASAPLLLFLYDGIFLSRGFREAWKRRKGFHLGTAATWSILIALIAGAPRGETVSLGFVDVRPFDYARTQIGVILHYLRLAIWPHPLVLDYGWRVVHSFNPARVAGGLVLLALVTATVWGVLRKSWAGFLGAWFFLILAPSSSFIPITSEVAAERRMYLPLIAVVVLALLGLWWALRRILQARPQSQARWISVALAAVLAAGLGALTFRRNAAYSSPIGIWEETSRLRPDNPRAYENLGCVLLEAGRRAEATSCFRRALQFDPNSAPALENVGLALLEEGRAQEAVQMLSRVAALQPKDGTTRLNLAGALKAAGDLKGVEEQLREAARLMPRDGLPLARLGLVLMETGRPEEAAQAASDAVRLEPGNAAIRIAAGSVYMGRGDTAAARAEFEAALRIDPGNAAVRQTLARLRGATSPEPVPGRQQGR